LTDQVGDFRFSLEKFHQESRMLKKATALLFIGVSLSMCLSCGNTISRYLYAALPAASQIGSYREDPNSGILISLSVGPIAAGPTVQSLAMHPSGKFLYAANSGEGDISLYTIASSGVLTEVTPRTKVGASTPTVLAMDPSGSYLYVGNAGTNNVSSFAIDSSSGALTAVSGSPFEIGMSPLNMAVSKGNVLYVTGLGTPGYIEFFSLASGVPTFINAVQPGNNPNGLAIAPNGSFLYVANTGGNSISEYSIGSDGALTELVGSPIGETYSAPLSVLVDNSGKFLFVANNGSSNVAAYSIGSNGSLTLLTNSPFASGAQPSYLAEDPKGNFLYVGNQSSPVIEAFGIDPNSGTLTELATYSTGNTPTSIAITP
jgi:6-phosphogluconolactonase